MICIADRLLDDGPITLRVGFPWHHDFEALGARVGMPLRMEGKDWLLGEDIIFRISGATRWVPPTISRFASHATALSRLRTLCHCLEMDVPEAGLAPLALHGEDLAYRRPLILDGASPLACVASQKVAMLVEGVWAQNQGEIDDAALGLIGLGPGLTPSGDDLLAGFMIGLIATLGPRHQFLEGHEVDFPGRQGMPGVIAVLARIILQYAATGTTQISNALLTHAVKGMGSESVHRLLHSLLHRDGAPEPTPAALKMATPGHTSGWDCLAGILVGVHLGLRFNETLSSDSLATIKTAV